jgi:hypothetical protein
MCIIGRERARALVGIKKLLVHVLYVYQVFIYYFVVIQVFFN